MLTKEEILKKKKHGDLKTAGAIIGISEHNAYQALNRVGSKHHEEIIKILSKVIIMREKLKEEAKTDAA